MTPGEHFDAAEELLSVARQTYLREDKMAFLTQALVHAVLATSKFGTPARPLNEVIQEVPNGQESGSEPA